ncbi:MAG: redox-sensing transcriptional repressor Rex [Deltaproteobacteria bacterium]|nr:redox-sensing transcriptional repressor Rex [Deltaproteobacteria bacterium]
MSEAEEARALEVVVNGSGWGGPAVPASAPGAELPRPTLERLALYYQIAIGAAEEGRGTIRSSFVARCVRINETLVRRDMAAAGIVGRPHIGYAVSDVIARLEEVFGLPEHGNAILVGCGALGSAIARSEGLSRFGLNLLGVFDLDPTKTGRNVGGRAVQPMAACAQFIEQAKVEIAVLTVPGGDAQAVADWLVENHIGAIWNFAPVHLQVPDRVVVRNEHLSNGLVQLIYTAKLLRTRGRENRAVHPTGHSRRT